MNVLGIIAFCKNPAACLLIDGKLKAFIQEERFTRLKGSHGMFPGGSVAECLRIGGIEFGDVDRIAFGWDCTKYPSQMLRHYAKGKLRYGLRAARAWRYPSPDADIDSKLSAVETLFLFNPKSVYAHTRDGLRAVGLKGDLPPIDYIPHHLAHAYSAYFCSDFDEAVILTIDGHGEEKCTELFIGRGNEIKEISSINIPHSLGWFYAAMTSYCGFTPYRDEGKLMGLAALGEERSGNNPWVERLEKVVRHGPGWYEIDPTFTKLGGHYYHPRFTDKLAKFIMDFDRSMEPISYGEKADKNGEIVNRYLLDKYVDIAWATQKTLESVVLSLLGNAVKTHGIRKVCLAGGVALNCKMNGVILKNAGLDGLFVQPAASDDGSALGAAMAVAHAHGENIRQPLEHTRFGPSYNNDEVRKALDGLKVTYRLSNDISQDVADELAKGRIVGWHQGGMEFGPRALGGRSILANPIDMEARDKVNAQVKYRESWRPFCPSLTLGSETRYLDPGGKSPFMIVAHDAKGPFAKDCPAVVHVDNTIRPQTVSESSNERYYKAIEAFGKHTGHPVVLNTSLNVRGEPIACTPLDSIRCFFSTGMDVLAIEDFILDKTNL